MIRCIVRRHGHVVVLRKTHPVPSKHPILRTILAGIAATAIRPGAGAPRHGLR